MSNDTWKSGDRIRVYATPGAGDYHPPSGVKGVVESQREDGTVLVNTDDGHRILVASWELKSDD